MIATSLLVTIMCYVAGRMRFSPLWVFLAGVLLFGLINRFYAKTRRQLGQEEKRRLAMLNPDQKTETAVWFTETMHRVWQFLAPQLEASIKASLETTLDGSRPAMVKKLSFKSFYLGRNGPKFSEVLTYAQTEDNVIRQDMKLELIEPECKITLGIQLNSIIGGLPKPTLNVDVKDLVFRGILTIDAKLQPGFPYAEILKVGFKTRPQLEVDIKPMGMEITALPWLGEWLMGTIESAIESSMVEEPLEVNLDSILNPKRGLNPEGRADGVLLVHVVEATGLAKQDYHSMDPFVRVTVDNTVYQTHAISKEVNPVWNRMFRFLVHRVASCKILVELFDQNTMGGDQLIASMAYTTEQIQNLIVSTVETQQIVHRTIELRNKDGRPISGTLTIGCQYFVAPPYEDPYEEEAQQKATEAAAPPPTQEPTPAPADQSADKPAANENGALPAPTVASPTPVPGGEGVVAVPGEEEEEEEDEEEELWQTGLLRIYIHAGRKFKSPSGAIYLQPYVTVHVHDKELEAAHVAKRKEASKESKDDISKDAEEDGIKVYRTKMSTTADPIFDEMCEVIIANRDTDKVTLRVKNKAIAGTEKLGDIIINVGTYLRLTNVLKKQWIRFWNTSNGQLQISLYFGNMDLGVDRGLNGKITLDAKRQMQLQRALGGAIGEDSGKLMITIHEAKQLKAADRGGTSDPFVVVRIKKIKVAQTKVIDRKLNPVWDETFAIPLPDTKGMHILFQVYDYDKFTPADPLGEVWFSLEKLQPDELGMPMFSDWLTLDKVKTGKLKVTMIYIPHGMDAQKRVIKRTSVGAPDASTSGLPTTPSGLPPTPSGLPSIASVPSDAMPPRSLSQGQAVSQTNLAPTLGAPPRASGTRSAVNLLGDNSDLALQAARRGSVSKPTKSEVVKAGAWGSLRMTVKSGDGLPSKDFHPFIKVKVGDKTVGASGSFRPAETVMFNYADTVPLTGPPETTTILVKVGDYTGKLHRASKTEYVAELYLADHFKGSNKAEGPEGENTVETTLELTPNPKAQSLYGDKKATLHLSLAVFDKAHLVA